jgi:dienelactone hydrolase
MNRILFRTASFALTLSMAGAAFAQHHDPSSHDAGSKTMEMDNPASAMSSGHMEMGPHMKMTALRKSKSGDDERATEILTAARRVLETYKDYRVAQRDGYQVFLPELPQRTYHFTNNHYALEAEIKFNPEHPTSLLYEKTSDGYRLLGAMYTAAARLNEEDLDRLIPLSIAQWHKHVNFCLPPGGRESALFVPNPRFGIAGSISTKEECDSARGKFVPLLFGWMVHVFPFEEKAENVWSMEPPTANAQMEVSSHMGEMGHMGPMPVNKGGVKESRSSFTSEGKTIPVEQYEPDKPGRYPAVVLLYGAGGMTIGGDSFQSYARELARNGYVVYLPHYFEMTGTVFAKLEDDEKYFAIWMSTIADAVAYAGKQPDVDAQRIGVMGFSLGAYLSLSVATVDPQVKAVVEFFGGLPEFFAKQLKTMPPTLILHGDADPLVPVKEAYTLETLFKQKKITYEIKIYSGQKHGFTGAADDDARQRVRGFLDKNLKG